MTTETLRGLISIPRLEVQDANAVSGPLTWGFPSPTAFVGFTDALSRKIPYDTRGIGIICHNFNPLVYKNKYDYKFILTKNPNDDGQYNQNGNLKQPSIIDEGRASMEVSLIIGVHQQLDEQEAEEMLARVSDAIQVMRLAGGIILPRLSNKPKFRLRYTPLTGDADEDTSAFYRTCKRLLPGSALVCRPDVLQEHLSECRHFNQKINVLDALLNLVRMNVEWDPEAEQWSTKRSRPGWLVPLPVGYGSISPTYDPGSVKNARDPSIPFRFVECLYGLGEWMSPLKLKSPQQMLWYAQPDVSKGLYLCGHEEPIAAEA